MANAAQSEPSRTEAPGRPTATLAEVDIRPLLHTRPRRSANHEEEVRAYEQLAAEMAERPSNLLQKLVEIAVELCQAHTAGLSLLDGDVFRWEAVAGVFAAARGGTMPRADSPCGVCIDRDSVQLMHLADRCFPALLAEPRFVEALLIPFHHHGRPIGTVWIVSHSTDRMFDQEDERIVRILSRFAASGWQLYKAYETVAKANAGNGDVPATADPPPTERTATLRALEQARHQWVASVMTTHEDERRRMARELHDEMGQHVTALRLGLHSLQLEESNGNRQTVARLQTLVSDLDCSVHRLARDLRPPALDDLGMVAALSHHVDEWSQQSGIAADFCGLNCDERLPAPLETTIYRIVQEALTNVARHSHAHTASVVVERRADVVVVVIEDDGRGFDAAHQSDVNGREHFGLVGIQERAMLLGGTATVESSPATGTSIFVTLPVRMPAGD